jgi:N-acetylmuramoyl-L-alanine amidase
VDDRSRLRSRFRPGPDSRLLSGSRLRAIAALALFAAVVAAVPGAAAGGTSGLAAAATVPASAAAASTRTPFVVVIDAGHQAHGNYAHEPIAPGSRTKRDKVAGGTSGIVTHAPESRVNLQVALRLRDALAASGITVVMVRTTQHVNIPNSDRARLANKANADLFVRIHCDGAAKSVHGILMLVPADNSWTGPIHAASESAGRLVLKAAVAATAARDRGISLRHDLSGFNWSHVPSIAIEMGNMKNAAEDRRLSNVSYQKKMVSGLVSGILTYLGK